jgi:hypothetical protein
VNVPLLDYVVDSFWPEARLVVEIDGRTTQWNAAGIPRGSGSRRAAGCRGLSRPAVHLVGCHSPPRSGRGPCSTPAARGGLTRDTALAGRGDLLASPGWQIAAQASADPWRVTGQIAR